MCSANCHTESLLNQQLEENTPEENRNSVESIKSLLYTDLVYIIHNL